MLGWIRRNAARTLARHALPPEREPSLFTRRLIDATMASVCAVWGCPLYDGVDDVTKNDADACVS